MSTAPPPAGPPARHVNTFFTGIFGAMGAGCGCVLLIIVIVVIVVVLASQGHTVNS